jgi:6-phosphogluconolactonase
VSLAPAASLLLFLGTAVPPAEGGGIHAVRLDTATGAFGPVTLAAATPGAGFLAWHPGARVLHALHAAVDGGPSRGGAAAFAFDAADDRLRPLGHAAAGTGATTHLAADPTGRLLALVSYGGGWVGALALGADGAPRSPIFHEVVTGEPGPRKPRQDRSHPHSVTFSPDGRHLYVCDLGLDAVVAYAVDAAAPGLTPLGRFATRAGGGPRHAAVTPDGRFLYVLHELEAAVEVFARDTATGALTPLEVAPALPADFSGPNTASEIRLHPSGRFLYTANRGHDSLALFTRDPETGRLTPAGHVPSGGRHPRNFALSPDGAWLVCANRDSGTIVSFRVDPATGALTPTGHSATVPRPISVLFAPAPAP